VIFILSEISYAIKRFNSLAGYELNFFEKELLGFSFFADGEIHIVENKLSQPYLRINTVNFNSDPKTKASYRNGLVSLIKKGLLKTGMITHLFLLMQVGLGQKE